MKFKTLTQLWKGLFEKAALPGGPSEATSNSLKIRPITKGLRLEIRFPAGAKRETAVSQVIWVSPAGSYPPPKALTVLLSPN